MAKFWEIGLGAVGDAVKNVQNALNNVGASLDVDGIFGNKTLAAVKEFQQKNNLDVDGIVGTNTWGSLVNKLTSAASNAVTNAANNAVSAIKDKVTGTKTTAPAQPTAPAQTNTSVTNGNSGWSYDPFQVSSETAAADKNRQDIASQKPGDFSYKAYEESDAVKQAQALLQQQLANKPGAYQSQWQNQLNETMDKILNREKFSYDVNGDALYQQYKDMYALQGQQAMMDTMGQAAAMTGGYGNSYAQTAGQQMYQGHLQQLNDKVPELYQLALNQYNREGEELYNQYGMYADRENQDYGRYRDTVSDYYTELNRLTDDARYQSETDYNRYWDSYNQAYGEHRDAVSDWQQEQNRADQEYWNRYDRDYNQYADERNLAYDNYWNDKNFAYQQDRDKVADSQWQKEFDEAQRQYNQSFEYQQGRDQVADSQWNQSFQYQQDRDKVSDSQWQQSFDYQKDRDAVSDQRYDKEFAYQQGRDQVADSQWQKEFAEAQRQYDQSFEYQQDRDKVSDSQWNKTFQYQKDRDKVSDSQWNKTFQYQQDRDKVSDSQWNQSFQYQQSQDKIANEQWQTQFDYQKSQDKIANSQWQTQFDYQKSQDKIANSQWQTQFDYQKSQDKIANSQWQSQFDYQKSQDKIANDQWNQTMAYQQNRDKVSDSQWQKEFDEAKRQYDQAYAQKNSTTGSTSSSTSSTNKNTNTTAKPKVGYDNGSLSENKVKMVQASLGVEQDGKWGPASKAAAGGLSADEAYKLWNQGKLGKSVVKEQVKGNNSGDDYGDKDDYADWGSGEWEGYFAQIRRDSGKTVAEKELNEMLRKGLIPKAYANAAAIGARGGSMGH